MIEHTHSIIFDVANLGGVNDAFGNVAVIFNKLLNGFWQVIHWIENK